MTLADLIARWESRGADLARLRASVDAETIVAEFVADLTALDRVESVDVVTLREASRIGGYSVDRLQHLVANGQLKNAGQKGRPRIRRADIPTKPGHRLPEQPEPTQLSSRRRIAASVVTGEPT